MTISGYWNTATSLASSVQLQSGPLPNPKPAPNTLNLNTFMNWSSADQVAYFQAKKDSTANTLTLQMFRKNPDGTTITEPDPDYVSTGPTDPKPLVPKPFNVVITLIAGTNGAADRITLAGTYPKPFDISPEEFLTWSRDSQLNFIADHGGGPIFLGVNGVRAEVAKDERVVINKGTTTAGDLITPTWSITPAADADFNKTPDKLAPSIFQSWRAEDQLAYIRKQTTQPVTIGTATGLSPAPDPITVSLVKEDVGLDMFLGTTTAGNRFTSNEPTRPALPSEFSKAPASLSPATFLTWRMEDRLAYVRSQGGASVTIGSGNAAITVKISKDVSVGGVVQRTSGDYEPIPYFYLSGSSSGSPSKVVANSAEWLFPAIDGDKNILSVAERPAEFFMSPSSLTTDALKRQFLASFATWNSGYQLEYIKTYGSNSFTTPTVKVLDIAAGTTTPRMTAVISPDDLTKLFIVQSLDKAAVARMTLNEQSAVANAGKTSANGTDSAFASMKTSLGLALTGEATLAPYGPNNNGSGYTSTPPRNPMSPIEYIRGLEDEIANSPAFNISSTTRLPAEAQAAFTSQLSILKEQLNNSGIVSPADIKKKVDDIRTRFNRLFAFYNVRAATAETWNHNNPDGKSNNYTVTVYADVISSDGTLNSVTRGYNVFLAQEKRIAELAEARMKLVRDDGIFNGKRLDVPYLVYKFQSLYNLSLEAQVVAETEEVNQQNDLLKTYAAIQDLINKTLSAFPKADDTKKAILGLSLTGTEDISSDQYKTLSMFEDFLSGSQQGPDGVFHGGLRNPLEVLRGVSRPTFDFFYNASYTANDPVKNYDLNEYTHTQWSTYGTRLSETVTIINQNSQIKMNDINSLDKERNRHFELANNALAKMSDILANIARIG